MDISITILDNAMKFCMTLLHIHFEGGVSQFFYLGLIFYFMLLEKDVLKIYKKLPDFSCKIKTKP